MGRASLALRLGARRFVWCAPVLALPPARMQLPFCFARAGALGPRRACPCALALAARASPEMAVGVAARRDDLAGCQNEEANPQCMARCKKFTAQYGEIICGAISHCSTLRQLRKVDDTAEAHWDCPACTEKLETWDAFLSHYETCGALPAEGPCTHEVIDPYGHTLVGSCE